MVTVPLLVAASRSGSRELIGVAGALSTVATFSLLPLLPNRPAEAGLKWTLLVIGHAFELRTLASTQRSQRASSQASALELLGLGQPMLGGILAVALAVLGVYCDLGGHRLVFRGRMEFLPLLLMSDASAVLVLGAFLRLYWLVAAAGP